MSIKIYEYYQGVALLRLLSNKNPTTLKLIETNDSEKSVTYSINDSYFYIKYATEQKRTNSSIWQFTISKEQWVSITKVIEKNFYFVLVCALKDDLKGGEFCLVNKKTVLELIDFNYFHDKQMITAQLKPNNSFKVWSTMLDKGKRLLISRNAIDKLIFEY